MTVARFTVLCFAVAGLGLVTLGVVGVQFLIEGWRATAWLDERDACLDRETYDGWGGEAA